MDYWHSLDVHHHENWGAFRASEAGPERIWLFTTKTTRSYWAASFREGDGLLFGRETAGCPEWLVAEVGEEQTITIPRFNDGLRSLNLSTSVGIATYEALRQLRG